MNNQENTRVDHVSISYQQPLSIDNMPIGYNKQQYMHKVNSLTYYAQQVGIDARLSKRINSNNYVKSTSQMNSLSGNSYVWDNVVELANLPTSGNPNAIQQQYVSVPVNNTDMMKTAIAIRNAKYVKPKANGNYVVTDNTGKPTIVSIPQSQWNNIVNQARNGNKFFSWLVNTFINNSRNSNNNNNNTSNNGGN